MEKERIEWWITELEEGCLGGEMLLPGGSVSYMGTCSGVLLPSRLTG